MIGHIPSISFSCSRHCAPLFVKVFSWRGTRLQHRVAEPACRRQGRKGSQRIAESCIPSAFLCALCDSALKTNIKLRHYSECAFNAQNERAGWRKVSNEFHIMIVEDILDIEPDPQRHAKVCEESGNSRVDDMDRDPIFTMDDRSKANQVVVDSFHTADETILHGNP